MRTLTKPPYRNIYKPLLPKINMDLKEENNRIEKMKKILNKCNLNELNLITALLEDAYSQKLNELKKFELKTN